jgi:hypothetical protein
MLTPLPTQDYTVLARKYVRLAEARGAAATGPLSCTQACVRSDKWINFQPKS